MIINFQYGFSHKDFIFGWHKKELYRLPSENSPHYYPLKKLKLIKVGKQKGYRCKKDKLSLKQLSSKTIFIGKKISIIQDKNCPFLNHAHPHL